MTYLINNGAWILSYDKFLSNFGDAFNLGTGVFTTPKSGVYQFSATAEHRDNYSNYMIVEKNNQEVMKFRDYDAGNQDDGTLTFNFILTLQRGDSIRLKVTGGYFSCGNAVTCTFNGHFIREI